MSKQIVKLTGGRLMEVRSGFLALQGRRLPPVSDMRVAMLFSSLRPAMDAYIEAMKKLQTRQAEAEALEEGDDERKRLEREISADLLALNDAVYELPAPRRRLTVDDLPPTYKSKDGSGERNSEGRAQIAVALSPEFFDLVDPDAEKGGPQLVDEADDE